MRKAFTIIELIIVIAILLILMGMLMPVVTGMRQRAKRKLAKTEIEGICLALEKYFASTGEYPPSNSDYGEIPNEVTLGGNDPTDPPLATSLYFYLCGPEGKGIKIPGDPRVYGPYIEFKGKRLAPRGGSYVVKDPWGNPYIYEEHRSFFSSKTATAWTPAQRKQEAKNRRAHNMMSYDLISRGPNEDLDLSRHDMEDNDKDGTEDEEDELLEPGADEPDDITNW
jgi:prepilin-type N-terminal cleavage/methylation domain-containing protein